MRRFIKYNFISIFVIVLCCIMTIGYALYDKTVSLNGDVSISKPGIVEITGASVLSSENVSNSSAPTYDGMNISFNLTSTAKKFSVTYLIEVTNNSFYDYTYTDLPINVSISNSTNVPIITTEITDYNTGDLLSAGSTTIKVDEILFLKVKIDFETNSDSVSINGSGSVAATEDNSGNIIAESITPISGNLQGDDAIACFTARVGNTFKYQRVLAFSSSNENIILVDKDGNTLSSFSIGANTTSDYQVCTKVSESSVFLTDSTKTTILANSGNISSTVGELTLAVDIDVNASDNTIPEVGSVNITVSETNPLEGEAEVSWSRIDSGGSSIVNYYVVLYNETAGTSVTYETGNDLTSYNLSNLSPGSYSAVVYGEDEAGNTGRAYLDSATTANGYASKSESKTLKWVFSVSYTLDGLETDDTNKVAYLYNTYEANLSLTATGSMVSMPNSITITMGGVELVSGTDYTYNSSTGKIIVNKVTGDITIEAAYTYACLIEGTKIRLADGSYKNIEDIDFNDLLMVVDHENGGITYEYPIWIEGKTSVDKYQQTTFSDGTILNTFAAHCVFSMDLLKYVSVTDKENFKVGTRVAKIRDDGSVEVVSVTSIEMIYDNVNYYHVSSTRYHNIIANDLLTTDGTIITTYTYDHNEDLTWTSEREEFLKTNDLFYYEDWTQLFPEHIFKGYRMEEAKYVYNQGILDIQLFADTLSNLGKNTITNEFGVNLWMVTTSDDIINGSKNYLREEGSYYTLKIPNDRLNFIGWYNTADNKMYNVGDKVRVTYGMHFIAKYK